MNSPKMYSFLHCPVQSGSDSVLADMKREYCIDDFKHVVRYLKERYTIILRALQYFSHMNLPNMYPFACVPYFHCFALAVIARSGLVITSLW